MYIQPPIQFFYLFILLLLFFVQNKTQQAYLSKNVFSFFCRLLYFNKSFIYVKKALSKIH